MSDDVTTATDAQTAQTASPISTLAQVQTALDVAKATHAKMSADLDVQGGVVAGLIRQQRDILSAMDEDLKTLELNVITTTDGALKWLGNEMGKIANAV